MSQFNLNASAEKKFIKLNSGYDMPTIGLGTWQAGPGEVGAAVTVALDAGYRHIDCADLYDNEKEIGEALTNYFATGKLKREDLFITSKLRTTDMVPERVAGAVEKILGNLRVGYLDLFLIHWPIPMTQTSAPFIGYNGATRVDLEDVKITATWTAMEKVVDSGKVRSIGICNATVSLIQELLDNSRIKPAVHQYEAHPFLTQQNTLDFCLKNEIAVTAYAPLGWGKEPRLVDDATINEIAKAHDKTAAQVLLRWGIQRNTIVIPKSANANRIKENFDVYSFSLTQEEMNTINGLNKNLRHYNPIPFFGVNVFNE